MGVLGIGVPEVILILVIAVLVVGPKRVPEYAVQLARAIRQLRGYATDVTSQMRAELDELTREYEDLRKELEGLRQSTEKDVGSVSKEVESATREVDRRIREMRPIIESSGEPEPHKRLPPPDESANGDGA